MPALLLERHFFTLIELKPLPEAKPEGQFNVTWTLTLAKDAEDSLRYQVTLKTVIEEKPGTPAKPYYVGTVEAVGVFRVQQDCKIEHEKLVRITGGSILYGSVRELVCNLTARGPWPMITLPTVTFTPPHQPKAEEPAAAPASQ